MSHSLFGFNGDDLGNLRRNPEGEKRSEPNQSDDTTYDQLQPFEPGIHFFPQDGNKPEQIEDQENN